MEHTSKNKTQPSLFSAPASVKPIAASHATCAQLLATYPFLADHVDETFLRNRTSDTNPRTGAAWIPKPIRSQYEIAPTLAGLLEWFATRAATRSDLPAQYANMQAMENALGANKKAIKFLLKHGAGSAQDPANRIAPLPLIRRAFEIIAKVADGQITGIDGLEQWNKDTELAKKLRLESEKLEDEKLLRQGDMLLSRDGTFAISQLVADELLWEKRDQPLRAALIKAPPTINRQHKTLLSGAGVSGDVIQRCAAIVTAGINTVLTKLRTKIPAPKSENESENE
jgi:hypothetical protein